MIHDFDTHLWIAKLPDGSWISAEDHSSAEPAFQECKKIRIEPICATSIQAVLEAEIPDGYTAFLRTDVHKNMAGEIVRLGYILALERGKWDDPGRAVLGDLPILDGVRAELCCWNGEVLFESSPNFSYEVSTEENSDIYKFVMR